MAVKRDKNGRFVPGQSGNPKGRPPKERALTALLEEAGSRKVNTLGVQKERKQVVADLAWQLVTEGQAVLPDGRKVTLETDDWLGMVKWIYRHIDGPPRGEIDVNQTGDLEVLVRYIGDVDDDDGGVDPSETS